MKTTYNVKFLLCSYYITLRHISINSWSIMLKVLWYINKPDSTILKTLVNFHNWNGKVKRRSKTSDWWHQRWIKRIHKITSYYFLFRGIDRRRKGSTIWVNYISIETNKGKEEGETEHLEKWHICGVIYFIFIRRSWLTSCCCFPVKQHKEKDERFYWANIEEIRGV